MTSVGQVVVAVLAWLAMGLYAVRAEPSAAADARRIQ